MADRRLRVRLGLFVATALAILSGLVVLFGGTPTLFSNRAHYVVLFPEAPGMAQGTPVRKSGVPIGEVTQLELDDATGQVRVGIDVDRRHVPRGGEDAVISRGLLSGDTSLEFVPRIGPDGAPLPRGEPLPPNSEIRGVPPVTARALMSQASEVIPTAQESMARMLKSFERIEKAVPKFERAADEFAETSKAIRTVIGTDEQPQPGKPPEPQPQPGKPPEPQQQATLRELLRELTALTRSLKPAAEELRTFMKDNGPELTQTLKSVRQTADSANDLLNPDNRKAVAATLKNLETASDDLTKTIRLVAIVADQAEKTLKEFNARSVQAERALTNIEKLTKPLADNADEIATDVRATVKNLNAASSQLSGTLTEAQATLRAITKGDGSLQKVLTDPSLYNNLNEATVGAARVLTRVDRIARDLEVFADKIARKPETIGVGGALRPSTGLKESPTAPLPGGPLPPSKPPAVQPFPPVSSYKPPPNDLPPDR